MFPLSAHDSTLLSLNRPQLKKLFQRLHPSTEGRVSAETVMCFAQKTRISPVFDRKDYISSMDLQQVIRKIRPGNEGKARSLSYLQFEQLLIRVSKRLRSSEGLSSLLETIQLHASDFKVTFSWLPTDLDNQSVSRSIEIQKNTVCFSEESMRTDLQASPRPVLPGAFLSKTPLPKSTHISLQSLLTSSSSSYRSQCKPLRKLGSELYRVHMLAPMQEGGQMRIETGSSVVEVENTSVSQVEKLSVLLDDFKRKWGELTDPPTRNPPRKPLLTSLRAAHEYAIQAKTEWFRSEFVKGLIFEMWKRSVTEKKEKGGGVVSF